jgi:hydrogenase-4 component E
MTGVAALAGAAALALSFATLAAGRVTGALALCMMQAAAVALAAAAQGWTRQAGSLGIAALLAIALNGIALPLALRRLVGSGSMPGSIGERSGLAGSAAGACVLATAAVAGTMRLAEGEPAALLAAGLSILLVGLLLPVARTHPAAPAIGLLASQSGVILAACAMPGVPTPVPLLAALPLVPSLAAAGLWLQRRDRAAPVPPWV